MRFHTERIQNPCTCTIFDMWEPIGYLSSYGIQGISSHNKVGCLGRLHSPHRLASHRNLARKIKIDFYK